MASKQIKVKVTILNEIDKIIGNHGSWSSKLNRILDTIKESTIKNTIKGPVCLVVKEDISEEEQDFLDKHKAAEGFINKSRIFLHAIEEFGKERVDELLK